LARVAAAQTTGTPPGKELCSSEQISYRIGGFQSGGKHIRVEEFRPRTPGKHPAIILVHGSGGLLSRSGKALPTDENFGEKQIACAGYVSFLVHYFDRSGILSTGDEKYMEEESRVWLEVLEDAVDYVSSQPQTDRARIGLLGESLGGYLALSLAMHDSRIRAVSEYGGGVRLRGGDDPRRLPPVLIQHGGSDSIVSVAEALGLARMLSENAICHEVRIYDGLDHYLNTKARGEAQWRSIRFFDRALRANNGACTVP
jgi:dienelactone hydrolase